MSIKIYCLLALFFFSGALHSLTVSEITCSHPQLCNLARELLVEPVSLHPIALNGDPHHFEPGPKELARLMRAKALIAGPLELHPWIKPVLEYREQHQLPTLKLPLDLERLRPFMPASKEALSHFWLLPPLHCEYAELIAGQLKAWQLEVQSRSCDDKTLNLYLKRLREIPIKKPLILAHDALEPLLRANGFQVLALKGSHHGESIHAESLKSLHEFQKQSTSSLWIHEQGISTPESLKKMVRDQDNVIEVNLIGKTQQPSLAALKSVLSTLLKAHGP